MVTLTLIKGGALIAFKHQPHEWNELSPVEEQVSASDRELLDLYDAIAEVKEQLEERELEREKNKSLT